MLSTYYADIFDTCLCMYVYKHARDHLMECLCLTLKSFLLCFGPYAFCQNLNYYAPGFEGTCQLYVSSYEFFDCEVCIIPVGAYI